MIRAVWPLAPRTYPNMFCCVLFGDVWCKSMKKTIHEKKNNLGEVVVNFNAEVGSVLSSVPRQPFNSSCHGDHYIIVEHVG